ncbi:adenylate/guanylate cyclase domain-containing protein [Mycobacterium hodleri]|uniref:Adenylate/guanylate cyclase domain-containing protein n=2 Tax=Mycolicibacterium hodleri TaxID=49897 RepID=A0A502DJ13_9MYCO|nr:adenylate/guanylate cyclase domain-containing protein [Mycolicibacterium hodleri]
MPSAVVTFLFTDIEGSTRRWEADAEAMRVALVAHDGTLQRAIADRGGDVFKHTGDGVCAVFNSPQLAVDAAIAAQRSLELPVRMGIATGEAEARGGDYFGAVLNRAARVMSAGHGGQILLDGLTADLLSGVDLKAHGSRRLRDIAKPIEIFQVRAPGLGADFPALKTADPTLGNLRRPPTGLIGRDRDVAELGLALHAHRVTTLIGVGGVGKTRLALEVADRARPDFLDGVWLIELASVTDPAAVPEAVAAVLGITQQPGMTLADSIAGALEGRTRLLVFDNCEHVLDASAELIESIIAASSTVRILATSREGLRVSEEQLQSVSSLQTGIDSAAVALFVERAQAVAPALGHRTEDTDAVVEICRRLDGIPLAIELAASRMQSMTVTELRDRLDDRFRLLIGSRRGLERHQTLRHAVQWSYDLLTEAETSLLTVCSVFAGGFDLAGAAAVGRSADDYATLDVLDALVRKSLLVADPSSGRTRYSMLETIRQFAEYQLVEGGAANEARTAHARHFASLEATVLATWDSARQREAYTWLNVELANLRAAFRWASDHDGLDSAAAIAIYSTILGSWEEQFEPVAWIEEVIATVGTTPHPRLAQLYVMATFCYATGRAEQAVAYAEAAQAAIESRRFDAVPYEAEAWIGGAYIAVGQPERWASLCRNMIRRDGGPHVIARASLALAATLTGAENEALAASDGLLVAAAATDNPYTSCFALLAYGFVRRDADPATAYDVERRGLQIAQDSGNRQVESHLAVSMSRLAATHGDPAVALDYFTLAIHNLYDSGNFTIMHSPLAILATFFDRRGDFEPAAIISGYAADILTSTAFPEINGAVDHLREVLGEERYSALAATGLNMTNTGVANYAFDQIDRVRGELG